MNMKENNKSRAVFLLLQGILAAALFVIIILAMMNVGKGSKAEELAQLEKSVRRAAVACYATEGVYPSDIDHLKEYYGLQIDDRQYIVHYDVFAENIMPDITVMKRTQ